MQLKDRRNRAVSETINNIRGALADGPTITSLEQAKPILMSLCAQTELFSRTDFPLPEAGETERTFLIHEDENGEYALYVNSGLPGQTYRPHDHGGSWAIVAAVSGREKHRLYRQRNGGPNGNGNGKVSIEQVGEIDVQPGTAVSMLPEGIHSIHALGDEPLLHLHLYGRRFADQSTRTEYDLENNTIEQFVLEASFEIEDAR